MNSKKIISLVQPNFQQGPKEFNAHYLPYSVGVLWSYVNQFDEIKNNYELDKIIWRRSNIKETATELAKSDIVAFSTYVWNKNYNYAVAQEVKRQNPNSILLFGGPEIPITKKDIFKKYPFMNYVIKSEGEITFKNLLIGLKNNNSIDSIPGLLINQNTKVVDIDRKNDDFFTVITDSGDAHNVSKVIICTGHQWSSENETRSKGWYDSPYPPSKFERTSDHPVAIRGTSLTAVDAVKTLARLNGTYIKENDDLKFKINEENKNFSITLFSKRGFLPALRFHSEGSPYSEGWIMSHDEIQEYKQEHNGFVDLDYVFDLNFKQPLRKKNEKFYQEIKDLTIEEFVEKMLELREKLDSFQLFKAEYAEAEKSIEISP
jgi:hypothetical protein